MAGMRVAVVTGANKGIGLAVVRALCKKFRGDVYLTARNPRLGEEAVKSLNNNGLSPLFHHLDINDQTSIWALRDFLKEKYGGLDVLINNAAIAFRVTKAKEKKKEDQENFGQFIGMYDNKSEEVQEILKKIVGHPEV